MLNSKATHHSQSSPNRENVGSPRSLSPDKVSLHTVHKLVGKIPPPTNLFKGLLVNESATPNNIIIFDRTDASTFRPDGVSNNFHHRFELVCALKGGGPVRISEHTFLIEPGDCALIFPNEFHHYIDVKTNALNWLFITFDFPRPDLLLPLKNSPRLLDNTAIDLLTKTLTPYIAAKDDDPDVLSISYHLSRFLLHSLNLPRIPQKRSALSATDDTRDLLLERVNSYVRSNLSSAPTITELAQSVDYSVSHLRAIFRERFGISLGRYIRESRLSEAAQLLQNNQHSVTEIAEMTGFESLFAFSRAFKNTYGIAPKSYSKMIRQHREAKPQNGKVSTTQTQNRG